MTNEKFKLFIRASRPFSLTASVIPVTLGWILALNEPGFSFTYLLLSIVAIIFLQASVNLLNDHDDFINDVDTKIFGSQGQQRTSILTMKFSSMKIIKEITGEYPVLLLDDVLSELDNNRKRYILSSIHDIQTIITCTGIDDLRDYLDDKAKIFNVSDGQILN